MADTLLADIRERTNYIESHIRLGSDRGEVTEEQYRALLSVFSETGGLTVQNHNEVMDALQATETFTQPQLTGFSRVLRMQHLRRGPSKPRRPMQTCTSLQYMLLQLDWDK